MIDQLPSKERRKCEFCGEDNPAEQISCWKCGLWKGHKYAVASQEPSKDQLAELKRYHAEIVEIDGAECEAMQLTRWAIEEIENSRKLIESEWFQRVTYKQQARKAQEEIERLRTCLTGISTCSTCEACRGAAKRALGEQA